VALGLAVLVTVASGLAVVRWSARNAARSPGASAAVAETSLPPAAGMSAPPPVYAPPPVSTPPALVSAPLHSDTPAESPGPRRTATRPPAPASSVEAARTSSGPPVARADMDGALPEVPAAPDPSRIYAESEVDVRPRKLALRLPSHPERLVPGLKRGEAISLTLSLVVGVDGSVSGVEVDRSSGIAAVDAAVTKALAGARFRAGEKGGVPVRTHVIFVFTFRGG
jgi:TonB family protein